MENDKALPDIISDNLKVLFIGFNPGITSAQLRHHYANRSNRFWRLLHESGLTPYRMKPDEDKKLLELGFGSTNIVDRPTKSAAEIRPEEFAGGCGELAGMIRAIRPRVICYTGIGVYRVMKSYMTGMPRSSIKISTGVQPDSMFDGLTDFVCSNPSGLNTIPYSEQLECFAALGRILREVN